MSLPALANHMAARGRNGDSMLVHMSPQEVQALQALAEKHGRTLTINPETGQPEAFSLKSLLPVLAGVALGPAGFGVMSAGMAGLTVGGITALATGDISRGLMAGLGAYGGADLGASLTSAGESALGAETLAKAGYTPEIAAGTPLSEAASLTKGIPVADKLSAGFNAVTSSPTAAWDFAKANWKPIAAAATPILADAMVPTTTKMPKLDSGSIRKFSFDPYGQTYTPLGIYPAEGYKGMADGGIVALASGGEFDWVGKGEPVVRMADGGLNLPEGWSGYTPDQKISYFNQNNVTPNMLRANAVGQSDIDWMSQHGYAGDIGNWLGANPNATYADIQNYIKQNQYNQKDVEAAMRAAGMSGADIYAAFNADIGNPANVGEDYGGLAGLSSNINYWLKNHPTASRGDIEEQMKLWSLNEADLLRATGKSLDQLGYVPHVTPGDTKLDTATTYDNGAYGNYGSGNVTGTDYKGNEVSIATPGDIITNPDLTRTVVPNVPGRPYGGFTGIEALKSAYTAGGGSLGPTNLFVPKTLAEFNQRYTNTGGSQQAYEYLQGKGASMLKPWTPTGEIMKPYKESVLGIAPAAGRPTQKFIFNPATQQYLPNPDYKPLSYDSTGNRVIGASQNELSAAATQAKAGNYAPYQALLDSKTLSIDALAAMLGISLEEAKKLFKVADTTAATSDTSSNDSSFAYGGVARMALGGIGALAAGGTARYNLGGYSDGGRLLRGPGDGVSDSIPATIGNKQPARLADGEFVVPARIVSELGNGSTEAGARKLYAMMDRVQKARGKTTGKGRVAANTSADKYLPA